MNKLSRQRIFFSLGLVMATVCLLALLAQRTPAVSSAGLPADELFSLRYGPAEMTPAGAIPGESAPAGSSFQFAPIINSEPETGVSNCRYGITTLGNEQVGKVDDLGSGSYLDFGWRATAASNGAQYIPMVVVKGDRDASGNYLHTYTVSPRIDITDPTDPSGLRFWLGVYPGYLWFVGNEVDRGPDPGGTTSLQGDLYPEDYARAYNEVYQYIKQYDAKAKVAVSGLVQVTPGRLQYLDLVWAAHIEEFGYPMPVDVWNMHLYILPEVNPAGQPNGIANVALGTNPALGRKESGGNAALCALSEVYCYAEHDDMNVFAEQVVAMRTWMKNHGERNKPLILSEYSLLYPYVVDGSTCFIQDEYGQCFTPQRVQNFLTASFNYLDSTTSTSLGYPLDNNRLIQQWVWFSVNNQDYAGSVSNLYNHDNDGNLTTLRQLGEMFISRTNGQAAARNLLPDKAATPAAFLDGAASVNVPIWVTFRNNGNTQITTPFQVTFYSNSTLTNVIGSATVTPQPSVFGCATVDYKANVTWTNLVAGKHRYWAKVDSQNVIVESNEGDNVIQGYVLVDPDQIRLPVISRSGNN